MPQYHIGDLEKAPVISAGSSEPSPHLGLTFGRRFIIGFKPNLGDYLASKDSYALAWNYEVIIWLPRIAMHLHRIIMK